MNLISNWQEVLQKAWSVKFGILAAVLGGMEAFFLAMEDNLLGAPPGFFAGLAAMCAAGAVMARIMDQPNIAPKIENLEVPDDTILPPV
jgi:hypothetical protein